MTLREQPEKQPTAAGDVPLAARQSERQFGSHGRQRPDCRTRSSDGLPPPALGHCREAARRYAGALRPYRRSFIKQVNRRRERAVVPFLTDERACIFRQLGGPFAVASSMVA